MMINKHFFNQNRANSPFTTEDWMLALLVLIESVVIACGIISLVYL
ncbi:hypothetical protein [Reichenbachiella sp. MSK19-1]|nr:hypothetical protein [Reichenbachiella sp. MSK19-1]